ncbi:MULTISPECIES: LacI family DNA-binding transcriptional regulator [Delftia]|jgi:LacI family transcriptional regulator|uniref:LacI family DNA-binding transcriptional regulator n=1 Tax=Delftia TaxID=80865 RepID=UPI00020E80A7|nr:MULTISPECIES: LacI family DNA-binding transcriptional regulator [Delftia]AEF89535.1 transcriptional regulator, LacI family [Delftia sp. Cs1-4]MBK0115290.1 LacI family DNA-binding transcriptional regulator [Delftia sp. S65]MBK0119199.1 LacI family DNA-binding transcriptional regulator [Delftia sp. S67]MBK0132366.1 LacI family DNA-binding transcriptional regulator [Delftia sp. S66]MCG3783154.1 LacI family DNA-binding transcriptional regulator [Delftia acidovorans]
MMNKPPSVRAVTILDVAAAAQVSKSTVSLVLKGSPLIPAETSERVRAAAAQLGYVYNRRAGELRRQSSNMVGVVINDLMNPFFAEVLAGLERRLADAGFITLMAHTSESLERQQKVLTAMREHNAAGIALCPALDTPASLAQDLQSWGIPLVVMIRTLGEGSYDFAGADNAHGVMAATRHLLAAGHRRIGFLGGLDGLMLEQRLSGCRAAFADAGLAFDEDLVFSASPTRTGGHDAMRSLLAAQPAIKAAICYNDLVAFGALSALDENGLRAGKDFALMGFDNVFDAAHSHPPLSTVDVRPAELGEQAATLLLARMAHPGQPRQQLLARPKLVLRQSA